MVTQIEKAQKTFLNWKKSSFNERKKILISVSNHLETHKNEYAKLITSEMGKVHKEAIAEIEKCALVCAYYAENGDFFLKDEEINSDGSKSYISYSPLGVILGVMPWNFPFWQVFRFAAPTLMAGNTIVLKHASNVPKCAKIIEKIFLESGAAEGVFQTLLINSSKVEEVINHPFIKAVTLTGSELAGSKVAEIAGRNIKKSVLELGGSDAFIILNDADLTHATDVAVKSRFMNCGQSCIAAKRFIVVNDVAEQFLSLFKTKVEKLIQGDPMNENTDYGPMAREDLAIELENQVQKSIQMGATLLCGGKRNGAYFEATIIKNVKKGMPAYHEELFGPVAVIIVVENEEEAINVANDSNFGLGGSVWTRNVEKGGKVAEKIESGAVFVNGLVKSDPRLPFGGIKSSGYGRELSYLGIREFTNAKTIWIA